MKFSQYYTETSLSRIWQHTTGRPLGIITAFRGVYDAETNMERNRRLAAEVRQAGYGYTFVKGSYIEEKGTPEERRVEEVSLLIVGDKNLKKRLAGWVADWEQEAAVYKPGSSGEAVMLLRSGGEVPLGEFHPNRISDYVTRLRNRPGAFTFESAHCPRNWIERWLQDRQG